MAFKISYVDDVPNFDALPVVKIINYPLEKRDYKPYSQNRMCVNDNNLFLQMWAFEVAPMPSSSIIGVFYIFPENPSCALSVKVEAGKAGECEINLLKNGIVHELSPDIKKLFNEKVYIHPFNGEDLQGVYWGYSLCIPKSFLIQAAGKLSLSVGDIFKGNFFKMCSDEKFFHQGCFFSADFVANPFTEENMGEFEIVSY